MSVALPFPIPICDKISPYITKCPSRDKVALVEPPLKMSQAELNNEDLNFVFTSLHMNCILVFFSFLLLQTIVKYFLKQCNQLVKYFLGKPL